MAVIVVGPEGESFLLSLTLGKTVYNPAAPWRLHLYANDYTPTKDVTLGDLTEVAASGYAPADLDASLWTDPVQLDGAAVSWYGSAPISFTSGGSLFTAYGYYVTDNADAVLLWACRFDAAQIGNGITPVIVSPSLTGRSENEPV